MKQSIKRLFQWLKIRERGESLLIVAFAMTALVGVAATATDLGVAYVKTAQTQTAADAAVLAAGMKLPVGSSDTSAKAEAIATAKEYLAKNGVSNTDEATITFGDLVDGSYHSISVTQPAVSETAFARIFGIDEITFQRGAEAKIVPCAALSDLVPLSIKESTLKDLIANDMTEHAILKYGSNTEDVDYGAFGAIDLDGVKGGGANDYTSWLANGYQDKLTIGTVLPIEPGNMTGPTYDGVVQRYNACTHFPSEGGCTVSKYFDDCPRVMKVPVIEYTDSSMKYVRVTGFAAFVLEDYTTYEDVGCVVGSYVDMVNIGAADSDLTGTAESFGVYSLILTR
ncbi:MAG: pilus assembly protein TadG-related protein [Eubacteriales bacterium]